MHGADRIVSREFVKRPPRIWRIWTTDCRVGSRPGHPEHAMLLRHQDTEHAKESPLLMTRPRSIWIHTLSITVLSVVLLVVVVARAQLVKCKKPDGNLYIGPTPPEDCIPTGTSYSAGRRGDDALSDDPIRNASNRRDEIEAELNKLAQTVKVLGDIGTKTESLSDTGHDLAVHTARPSIARSFDRLDKTVHDSRREELHKMRALYDEWDSLRKKVASLNGGQVPSWWRDELHCPDCPSRANIDAKLVVGSE
jgi:hypothetical protein